MLGCVVAATGAAGAGDSDSGGVVFSSVGFGSVVSTNDFGDSLARGTAGD
jgi:hypothetical protein